MLSKEDFIVIQALRKRGVYQVDIAEELGVHPKTVSRALKRGEAPAGKQATRPSKLDPFKAQIDTLLKEGVWNAVVILREVQASGYTGGESILRDYIKPKRQLRKGKVTVRFETPAGRQLQTDWGSLWTVVAGEPFHAHFIVNTLGFSRRFHFWCAGCEDAEHTYEGLVRSFEYFGGVTAEVLVDNQKAAVIEHRPGGRVRFNRRFLDLAGHYGFRPRACQPGRPETKGKDERMVGYIKGNFFARYREFDDPGHMNRLAEQWLREEADPRVHGTLKEVVADRFEREAPQLQPLPPVRYDSSYWESRQAAWDAYIDVRGTRYSVPAPPAGQRATIRIGLDGLLRIYDGEALVADQRLQSGTQGWVTVPAHHEPLWAKAIQVQARPLTDYVEVS